MPKSSGIFEAVNRAVGAEPLRYIGAHFPRHKVEGKECLVINPLRSDESFGSFKINLQSGKWLDGAVGESGGDWVSLHQYIAQKKRPFDAAKDLAKIYGIEVGQREQPQDWRNHGKLGRPDHRWVYRREQADGTFADHFYVCRFDPGPDRPAITEKVIRPYNLAKRRWGMPTAPLPMYNLEAVRRHETKGLYVVCEGEKAAEAMQTAIDAADPKFPVVAITWAGGVPQMPKTDWHPLADKKVLLVPDNDMPGREVMAKLAQRLRLMGNTSIRIADICKGREGGADAYDIWYDGSRPDTFNMLAYLSAAAKADTARPEEFERELVRDGMPPMPKEGTVPELDKKGLLDPFKPIGISKTPDRRTLHYNILSRKNVNVTDDKEGDGGSGVIHSFTHHEIAREASLLVLASNAWWEERFLEEGKSRLPMRRIASWLIRECHKAGWVDIDMARAGRGVWRKERNAGPCLLTHAGDAVHDSDDNQWKDPWQVSTNKRFFEHEPRVEFKLLDEDKISHTIAEDRIKSFLAAVESLPWQNAGMGHYLAGWIAIAPFCGALRWRPHIFLTGPKGSGKSTVLRQIVHPGLGNWRRNVMGATTEAGLRRLARIDAMPVIFDEAEEKEGTRWQDAHRNILHLARVASDESEGAIHHADQAYKPRMMMLMCAITSGMRDAADVSRFFPCQLRHGRDTPRKERDIAYRNLLANMHNVTSGGPESFADLLFSLMHRRFLFMQKEVFPVIAKFLGDEIKNMEDRQMQQMTPMLAGAWIVRQGFRKRYGTDGMADLREWLASLVVDLQIMQKRTSASDELTMLETMLSVMIRIDEHGSQAPLSLLLEIERAVAAGDALEFNLERSLAEGNLQDMTKVRMLLATYGIRVYRPHGGNVVVFFANNNTALNNLLRNTAYGNPWRRREFIEHMGGWKTTCKLFGELKSPTNGLAIDLDVVLNTEA